VCVFVVVFIGSYCIWWFPFLASHYGHFRFPSRFALPLLSLGSWLMVHGYFSAQMLPLLFLVAGFVVG